MQTQQQGTKTLALLILAGCTSETNSYEVGAVVAALTWPSVLKASTLEAPVKSFRILDSP